MEEPEEPALEESRDEETEEEKERERIKSFLGGLSKSQLLGLYEKLAVAQQMTDFEQKILAHLDPKVLQKIRTNLKYKNITDISKVIEVDSRVLNYGEFYPGKILGSTLLVQNTSPVEQIVEIAVDVSAHFYNSIELVEEFKDIPELAED
jgi:hypothetical protein